MCEVFQTGVDTTAVLVKPYKVPDELVVTIIL